MPLYLPNSVLEDAERRGQVKAAERSDALMRYWTEELRRIDPYLTLVWVAKCDHPDLVPHCYHIRRNVPDGADEYWPLIGDNPGERREPGSWMLEELKANDMFNPRVHRSKREAAERRRQAKVRAKQTEEEQRVDEMTVDAAAAYRLRGPSQLTKTMAHKRAGKGIKK
jgi:hypothetical protein